MADIFISYRRKDSGWAATWIADQLELNYDVFFDRNDIDYGDQFPPTITQALKECRVFLAIIGPEWDSAENLKRLQEEKDWVRQEIQTVLDSKGVRTVPVLLDREKLPLEEVVPEKLHALLLSEAMPFSNKKRASDLELLKKKLNLWLVRGAYQAEARRPLPSVVPQLCNRVAQEENLVELFSDDRPIAKTVVVILHGHRWEEHLGFIDRLRHRHVFVDALGLHGQDVGILMTTLQWNVDRAAEGQYEKVLRTAIKRHVLQSATARDQEMQVYFRTIPQPQVLLIQVTWSDYRKCGEHLIEGFITAWRQLFEETDDQGRIVPLEPPFPVVLWINISYENMNQEVSVEKLLGENVQKFAFVLPKLTPLMEGDIQTWVGLNEVRRFMLGNEGRVLALIENPDLCCDKGKMHMRCFVEKVREILSG